MSTCARTHHNHNLNSILKNENKASCKAEPARTTQLSEASAVKQCTDRPSTTTSRRLMCRCADSESEMQMVENDLEAATCLR